MILIRIIIIIIGWLCLTEKVIIDDERCLNILSSGQNITLADGSKVDPGKYIHLIYVKVIKVECFSCNWGSNKTWNPRSFTCNCYWTK